MALYGEVDDKPIFSLAPGRHFDERIYYEVQEELERLNWASVSHTFDVKDGIKTISDHAKQMTETEAETGAPAAIRVGWSWGANPAIWEGSVETPVSQIILPAGAFHKSTVAWAEGAVPETAHNILYGAFEANPGPRSRLEIAKTCLFTKITEEDIVLSWAKKMGAHPRVKNESTLKRRPRVPIDYIILTEDNAVLNQAEIAKGLAKQADVTVTAFESDHVPMVYRPRAFARLLVEKAVAINKVPINSN